MRSPEERKQMVEDINAPTTTEDLVQCMLYEQLPLEEHAQLVRAYEAMLLEDWGIVYDVHGGYRLEEGLS